MADDGPEDRLYPPRPILAVSSRCSARGGCWSGAGRGRRWPDASRCRAAWSRSARPWPRRRRASFSRRSASSARSIGFNRHVEPIVREGGRVRAHFVIASFVGRWIARRGAGQQGNRRRRLDRARGLRLAPDDAGARGGHRERAAHRERKPVRLSAPNCTAGPAPRRGQRPRAAVCLAAAFVLGASLLGASTGQAGAAETPKPKAAARTPAPAPPPRPRRSVRRPTSRSSSGSPRCSARSPICATSAAHGDSAEFRAKMAELLDAEAADDSAATCSPAPTTRAFATTPRATGRAVRPPTPSSSAISTRPRGSPPISPAATAAERERPHGFTSLRRP